MQIYAETESKENELVRFSLPRCYRICGRRPNCAEAGSNASLLAIAEAQQYMRPNSRIAQEKPRISAIPHKEPALSGTLLPDGICSLDDRKPA